MLNLKYIASGEIIVVFTDTLAHFEMAKLLGLNVSDAGFCLVSAPTELPLRLSVCGDSKSLGLNSNTERTQSIEGWGWYSAHSKYDAVICNKIGILDILSQYGFIVETNPIFEKTAIIRYIIEDNDNIKHLDTQTRGVVDIRWPLSVQKKFIGCDFDEKLIYIESTSGYDAGPQY